MELENKTLYIPLDKKEIRLLTIRPGFGVYGCKLATYLRKDAPAFDAISYHWGEERVNQMIRCNGQTIDVARTISDCIQRLSKHHPSPRRPIWIDAICLNQSDDVEKALHVPRMRKVYSKAERTLIWLGRAEHSSKEVMDKMPRWLQMMNSADTMAGFRTLVLHGLPPISSSIWQQLRNAYQSPWFGRLWTLQEVVMARDAILLYGDGSVEWRIAKDFVRELYRVGCLGAIHDHAARSTDFSASHCFTDVDKFQRKLHSSLKGVDLAELLHVAQERACTEPIDRVWAVMGLMPPESRKYFQETNTVDYSANGKIEFWRAYLSVAKYWIEQDAGLKMLSMSSPESTLTQLPSWCPNLNSRSTTYLLLSTVGYRAGWVGGSSPRECAVQVAPTSDVISVPGFWVDRVKRVADLQNSMNETIVTMFGPNGIAQQRLQWNSQYLDMAQDTLGTSIDGLDAYATTLSGDMKPEVIPGESDYVPISSYQQYIRLLQACVHPEPDLSEINRLIQQGNISHYNTSVKLLSQGRRFFTTENGRIGMGNPRIQAGDNVCVFNGGGPVYLLRQKDGEAHRFIGDAYVHGLMYGEAFTAPGRGNDTTFVID